MKMTRYSEPQILTILRRAEGLKFCSANQCLVVSGPFLWRPAAVQSPPAATSAMVSFLQLSRKRSDTLLICTEK
jgi:hypothetical protein